MRLATRQAPRGASRAKRGPCHRARARYAACCAVSEGRLRADSARCERGRRWLSSRPAAHCRPQPWRGGDNGLGRLSGS
eukprot:3334655-Lingulodinium_polyedra.AAC.1